MLLWVVFAILTVIALLGAVLPLLRGTGDEHPRAEYDLQVYRHQLDELQNDLDRGAISTEEEAAARTEIERRILSTETADGQRLRMPSATSQIAGGHRGGRRDTGAGVGPVPLPGLAAITGSTARRPAYRGDNATGLRRRPANGRQPPSGPSGTRFGKPRGLAAPRSVVHGHAALRRRRGGIQAGGRFAAG